MTKILALLCGSIVSLSLSNTAIVFCWNIISSSFPSSRTTVLFLVVAPVVPVAYPVPPLCVLVPVGRFCTSALTLTEDSNANTMKSDDVCCDGFPGQTALPCVPLDKIDRDGVLSVCSNKEGGHATIHLAISLHGDPKVLHEASGQRHIRCQDQLVLDGAQWGVLACVVHCPRQTSPAAYTAPRRGGTWPSWSFPKNSSSVSSETAPSPSPSYGCPTLWLC